MKKITLLLLLALVLLACLTPPPGGDPEVQRELEALMENWQDALGSENIDAFMEVYWPEAEKMILQRDGGEMVLRGLDQIRQQQAEAFDRFERFGELRYSDPEREFHGNGAAYHYQVEGPDVFFIEHFEFIRRDGRWAIMHQVIDLRAGADEARDDGMAEGREPMRVASAFQAWADSDGDDRLEPPELQEFLDAVRVLIQEPHPVRTPADEFFDSNRDGEISHPEMVIARNLIYREQLRRLYHYDPDIARQFDFNNDEWVSLWEIAPITDLLFIPEFREPREAMGPLERRIDRNRDGFVDEEEFDVFARRIFVVVALLPLPPVEGYDGGSKESVFTYVDLNENGRIDPPEEGDLVFVVQEMVTSAHGRPVQSPLEAYFDRNSDVHLALPEIEQARIEFMEAAISRLLEADPGVTREYIDRNGNNRIDEEEVELVLGRVFTDQAFREPHRVRDPLDERLDRNRNGQVETDEMGDFFHRVVRVAAMTWLEAPDQRQERWAIRSALDELTDLNRNGFVDQQENKIAMASLGEPHRVQNEFDRRIDFNGNGTVDDIEIIRARRAGNVITEEPEEAARTLPVETAVDTLLDLNGDRQVNEEEIRTIIRFLQQPERPTALGKWWSLLDFDRNGTVSREELLEGWERYLRPHPVNPEFRMDRELDSNGNGFVEPQEIGIAAGFTRGRPIPSFDERLEQLGWRE